MGERKICNIQKNKKVKKIMEYKHTNPETGETEKYEISYSQKLQQEQIKQNKRIEHELRRSNQIKYVILAAIIFAVLIAALLISDTGAIGSVVRWGVCQTCGGSCVP